MTYQPKLVLSIITAVYIVSSDAARILGVFPVPSISHQVVFRSLTQELARRGHELIILTPDPAFEKGKAPENITEIDLHEGSYKVWFDNVISKLDGTKGDAVTTMTLAVKSVIPLMENLIMNNDVQELIKRKPHFDLLLTEACVRAALVFSHVFKAPVIQVSSFWAVPQNYQVMGSPMHPILYPAFTRQRHYNLSVWEKIQAIYSDLRLQYAWWSNEDNVNEMLRKHFGVDTPSVMELTNNVDMMFLNLNPIWEGNRAVPPGVIHMGGLPKKPVQALPEDLQTYLDGSKHGVIYMSFGSNVVPSILPAERIQYFCRAFSKLPYDVIWKFDKDELPGKPDNVRLTKWVPQSDLLRHPKIKLFITQAGLQSTDEALTAGVPLIGIPMLGDQWLNAEKYVHHRIGLKLDSGTITEESLIDACNTVIEDDSYRQNIVRLGKLMNDQPQSALDRATWWAEYVIRHRGARHLRSPAANISWTDYLILDVVFTLLGVVLAVMFVVVRLVKRLSRSRGKDKVL